MSRAEWLEQRRTGLGGSDIAAVLGIRGSAVAVWADKVLPVERVDSPGDRRMAWGKRLEAAIAEEYAERTGTAVELLFEQVRRHPRYDWWIGSPDALVKDPKTLDTMHGLEIKTSDGMLAYRWGEEGEDAGAPEEHIIQATHYMGLMGLDRWDIYALLGGNDDRIYTVYRDENLIELIAEEGSRFWREHVLANVAPKFDGSERAGEYLKRRFGQVVGDIREATEAELALARRAYAANLAEKAAKTEKERLAQEIKAAIGEGLGLSLGGGAKVTWSTVAGRQSVDWKRAVVDLVGEEQANRMEKDYTVTGPSTRRLNWPRKEW